MSRRTPIDRNRRHLLQAMLAFPAAGIAGFTGFSGVVRGLSARGLAASEQSASLPLTPACDDGDDDPTPAQTAGPYFKPHSPERTTLVEPGLGGIPLTITGRVVTSGCLPIAGALLDFWQADHNGQYDTAGFRLRGHQYHRSRRTLLRDDDRAGPVYRPDASRARQGAGAESPGAHDAAVFPWRAAQQP